MKKERLYVVVHNHRFGHPLVDSVFTAERIAGSTRQHAESTYVVRCGHKPSIEEVVDACGIDFEPNIGEYIVIDILDEIIDIP